MVGQINPIILEEIQDIANEKIDHVLAALDIDVDNTTGFNYEIRCACPVHGGDNPTAFSYNIRTKRWRCFTRRCHDGNPFLPGLVQKVLSRREQREVSFKEALFWLTQVIEYPFDGNGPQIDPDDLQVFNLVKQAKTRNRVKNERDPHRATAYFPEFPIDRIDGKVEPSPYFLEEGFSKEILIKYNVGFCDNPRKPMYMRSYVPVLDFEGKTVVGVTGRTILPACDFCSWHHEEGKGCPVDNPLVKGHPKWLHYGFNQTVAMYNSNFALPYIKESGVVILTEGPKEVWWLEQHGVHNSLCVLGLYISDYHVKKFINMGVRKIVVALDNDEPGIEAMERINESLADYFNLTNMNNLLSSGDDIDDVPTHRMEREIVPFLKSLEKRNV